MNFNPEDVPLTNAQRSITRPKVAPPLFAEQLSAAMQAEYKAGRESMREELIAHFECKPCGYEAFGQQIADEIKGTSNEPTRRAD